MSIRQQLLVFFMIVACIAAAGGIHESIFNNFLSDTFQIEADQRGLLEFPRELPGLLVVLMTGILAHLTVTQMGVVGALMFAAPVSYLL